MYSIDINLLRERAEYQTGEQSDFTGGTSIAPRKYSKIPMFVGVGVAALALLATGGGWLWLGDQTTQLEAKQKALDVKLGSLKAQDARLAELNGKLAQVTEESQSFASVFNQIQPWSAVLQDLRESIPQGVQIGSIVQTEIKGTAAPATAAPAPASGGLVNKISTVPNPEAKPGTPAPAAPAAATPAPAGGITTYPTLEDSIAAKFPPGGKAATSVTPSAPLAADVPTTKLDITGTAKSFDEVNNFILTLKQSAFFNPDETQLLSTSMMAPIAVDRVKPPVAEPLATTTTTGTPVIPVKPNKLEVRLVEYKIQTTLKRIPAADLMGELERKGAVGLVARLKSLQQQQVIK
ncbi:MAG: PilN domain-containing protein [Chamaesiphon sp.]|nr:PilN domain-containing protein [Chamaesiphon sp.]